MAATSLYHHIAAYMAELVAKHGSTDDGTVVYHYFACKFGRVADDAAAANFAVVGYVHIFHQQVVGPYDSSSF